MNYHWQELVCDDAPLARSSHALTGIGNKVYCIGGENEARVPIDMVVYELDLDVSPLRWRAIDTEEGSSPSPRIAHGQAAIGNRIWIFGGRNGVHMGEGPRNDIYYFDTTIMSWTGPVIASTETIPPPRSFHKMVSVGDVLYVFGGCGEDGRLNDLFSFDTTTFAWTELAVSPNIVGRGGPGFVALPSLQSLVVATGYSGQENNDIHVYHIPSNRWTEVAAAGSGLFRARSVCPVATVGSHYMVLFGGEVATSDRGHEGAGDFAADVVCLDLTGSPADKGLVVSVETAGGPTPIARGWTEMASIGCGDESEAGICALTTDALIDDMLTLSTAVY